MNVSSLAAGISSFKAAQTAAQIQVSVTRKALDQHRAQGDAVVQLIESVRTNLGDAVAPVANGIGGALDKTA